MQAGPLGLNITSKNSTVFVIVCSILIAVCLCFLTWDINFWPTDTKVYYFDATLQVPQLKHISQIHESFDQARVRWLHGKEMFILSASWMQRLLNDRETLRPFVLVCILSVCFSSILVFLLGKRYWGPKIGLFCFFMFVTSFWPYIYILFAKHQPLGLFFFLLALYLLPKIKSWKVGLALYFLSGLCLGLSWYSSSVSTLYMPYYFAGFIYQQLRNESDVRFGWKEILAAVRSGGLILLGFAAAVGYFNYPDIIHNIKSFFEYVEISGSYNHFYYNQRVLQQWMPAHTFIRGGWVWVIKYFILIMPVLFPLFVTGVVYLIWKLISHKKPSQKFRLIAVGLIFLSLSSPILAEFRRVAQYGANYFTSFVGIIMLLGYVCFAISNSRWFKNLSQKTKSVLLAAALGIAALQVGVNAFIFFDDVYPSRMATTFISNKVDDLGTGQLYTYFRHPHQRPFVQYLNPGLLKKIQFLTFRNLMQVKEGYILLPPTTGNSIYVAATSFYADFDDDIYLNEIMRKGKLEKYGVASFKTLASSRIWPHEEEILSYRYLMLNHFSDDIAFKGKAWLLDAGKIQKDRANLIPSRDYLFLSKNEIANIGIKEMVYIYEGYQGQMDKAFYLKRIAAKMYKVGDPKDQLIAYIYRVDDQQDFWVPHSEHFMSQPVSGESLTSSSEGGVVLFQFEKPLQMLPAYYYFVIYRTGEPSDENFYRIYKRNLGTME